MTERGTGDALRDRLRRAGEVSIVTSSAQGERHRTIIWIVVDDADRILVRSYRGPGARWYREAASGRSVTIEADGQEQPMRVDPATDPERIAACSRAITAKYAGESETPEMLRPEVLGTTLELVPVGG